MVQCNWDLLTIPDGYGAIYFSIPSETAASTRGVSGGTPSSKYTPAYSAIWARYAPPPSQAFTVNLDTSLDLFDANDFKQKVATKTSMFHSSMT